MNQPSPLEWVTVRTTVPQRPFPQLDTRPDIKTERLILRRTIDSDIDAWHALRIQPEVMQWTGQGAPDPDLEWSKDKLKQRLSPEGDGKYEFVICLADTGEMIGTAGCHLVDGELGWPVVGYMIRKEFWGKGYATEIVAAFLSAWWALPRTEAELKVEKSTAVEESDGKVRECIVAVTADNNQPSQRVLAKSGLKFVKAWHEADSRDKSRTVTLYGFVGKRPAL